MYYLVALFLVVCAFECGNGLNFGFSVIPFIIALIIGIIIGIRYHKAGREQ